MIRLWPWRRATQPTQIAQIAQPAQICSPDHTDDPIELPYGPWSSVNVFRDTVEPGGTGWHVASRCFTDPDEAARVHNAWKSHDPELTVHLRHGTRSSEKPCYDGFYRDSDGEWHDGQPAEIDTLIAKEAAAAQEREAQRARETKRRLAALDAMAAELEARIPKEMVVAEADDDSPIAHHDKFVKATQVFVSGRPVKPVQFHFTEFSGSEPKPDCPESAYAQVDTEDDSS